MICLFLLRFLFFWFLNFVTGFWFCGYVCLIHGVTWKKGWILEVWAVLEVGEQKPFTLVVFFMQLFLCFSSLVLCSSLESKDHIPPFFSVFVNLGSRFCISIVEVVKSYQILSLVYMFFFFPQKLLGIWWLRDWEIFEFVCIWQDQFARTRMDLFLFFLFFKGDILGL